MAIFCFYHFIKGDLNCAYVVAQLTVGPSTIDCGSLFTGYYYNLNFGVFVKLITRPSIILHTRHYKVFTISF